MGYAKRRPEGGTGTIAAARDIRDFIKCLCWPAQYCRIASEIRQEAVTILTTSGITMEATTTWFMILVMIGATGLVTAGLLAAIVVVAIRRRKGS